MLFDIERNLRDIFDPVLPVLSIAAFFDEFGVDLILYRLKEFELFL